MPIRQELRGLYPIDWPRISAWVRFTRARGRCEQCGRRHKTTIVQLGDGRWFDDAAGLWRDDKGELAPWPDLVEWTAAAQKHVITAAAHLDHDPANVASIKALCGRCHLRHDRAHHLAQRRITYRLRRAMGDLFLGRHTQAPEVAIP